MTRPIRWTVGLLVSCLGGQLITAQLNAQPGGVAEMALAITSPAFAHNTKMPKPYTCEGSEISPPLAWTDPPAGTKSFALINDDPDAPVGTWVHWVIYNIPATSRSLPENVPNTDTLDDGTTQGLNDFRRVGYGGPCPPPGSPHRYFFKLYALDTALELPPKATKAQVERAIEGHGLAQAQLIGLYQR
mgnify:CR=1 FL=1